MAISVTRLSICNACIIRRGTNCIISRKSIRKMANGISRGAHESGRTAFTATSDRFFQSVSQSRAYTFLLYLVKGKEKPISTALIFTMREFFSGRPSALLRKLVPIGSILDSRARYPRCRGVGRRIDRDSVSAAGIISSINCFIQPLYPYEGFLIFLF